MALSKDLLLLAEDLVNPPRRRVSDAALRRAVSTAYYAVFHLLVADAVHRFVPKRLRGLESRVARVFGHKEMKDVCRSIAERHTSQVLSELVPSGFSEEIVAVARTFVVLQEARHSADYDLSARLSRTEALEYVELAFEAFRAWERVRTNDEATIFLAALMFAARWK